MTGDYNPSRLIDYNSIALGSTIRLIAQFSFLLSIVLSLNFRFIGRRRAEFDRIITRKTMEIARLGNAWKNKWKIEKKEPDLVSSKRKNYSMSFYLESRIESYIHGGWHQKTR